MTPNLAVAVRDDNAKRVLLLERFPCLADDEDALLDTLEGVSDLTGQIVAVVDSAIADELLVDAIKARMGELKARAERIAARADAKRAAALNAMLEVGRTKIEAPGFTLSAAKKVPAVIITDEAAVPAEYLRQPEPPAPKPDKKAIGDALKAGASIPGCLLSNGGHTLTVRRA